MEPHSIYNMYGDIVGTNNEELYNIVKSPPKFDITQNTFFLPSHSQFQIYISLTVLGKLT